MLHTCPFGAKRPLRHLKPLTMILHHYFAVDLRPHLAVAISLEDNYIFLHSFLFFKKVNNKQEMEIRFICKLIQGLDSESEEQNEKL